VPGGGLRVQIIKRSEGRNVVAAAAYRARDLIRDLATGEEKDFRRSRRDVVHSEIMAPENAPAWVFDRARLWNAVEAAEKRHDAQLAREIMIPLPHELDEATRRDVLRAFIRETFIAQGMVADLNIHRPGREGDERNHHAHIMLTMRALTPEGFGGKVRAWNDRTLVERWHREWEQFQNREFEHRGLSLRVDYRSFEAREIDREPEQHQGPAATGIDRKGRKSRVVAANENRRARNSERADLHRQALEIRQRIARERQRFEQWTAEKAAELAQTQQLSRFDFVRRQELERERLREDLAQLYDPHLRTVEAEATAIRGRAQAWGVRALWRRVSGKQAREAERLREIEETIRRTDELKAYELAKQAERQRTARDLLEQRQQWRREAQAESFDRTRARKEEGLRVELLRAARLEAEQAAREAEAAQMAAFRAAAREQQPAQDRQQDADTGPPATRDTRHEQEPQQDHDHGRERGIER
jgi:hypothetical protein